MPGPSKPAGGATAPHHTEVGRDAANNAPQPTKTPPTAFSRLGPGASSPLPRLEPGGTAAAAAAPASAAPATSSAGAGAPIGARPDAGSGAPAQQTASAPSTSATPPPTPHAARAGAGAATAATEHASGDAAVGAGDAWATVGRVFLPPPRLGTDITPEPLEPPPIVTPSTSATASPITPAPPVLPGSVAGHGEAAGARASHSIDRNDASATSKFDVASLSSSRIDASDVPAFGTSSSHEAIATADAAGFVPEGRDSAPLLPPAPVSRGSIKLPGIASIAGDGGPAPAAGDELAARFGATGAAGTAPAASHAEVPATAWPGDPATGTTRGRLAALLQSPRRIAIAAGGLVIVIAVAVFAMRGGSTTPSAARPPAAPAAAPVHEPVTTLPDETPNVPATEPTHELPDEAAAAAATSADTDASAGADASAVPGEGSADEATDAATDAASHDPEADRASPRTGKAVTPANKTATKRAVKAPSRRIATKRPPKKRAATKTTAKKPRWDPDTLFPTKRRKKK